MRIVNMRLSLVCILEGAIKEVWGFEITFFVEIDLRKYNVILPLNIALHDST